MARALAVASGLAAARALLFARHPADHTFEPLPWEEAEARARESLARMSREEKRALLHGSTAECGSRQCPSNYAGYTRAFGALGIPPLKMQDAASGFRPPRDALGTTTCFPSLLALASTWDGQLAEAYGAAVGAEFHGKGANVLLGPAVNVHRTAWGGRNFEYLSGEDPQLGAVLTRAYIRGVHSNGVMTVAKHYAFNEQESERFSNNVEVDARTAWELYYPPFEAAVEAGVGAVMCAYNRVNGSYACGNSGILQRDLKERMGFRGFVLSDWGATLGLLATGGDKMVQRGLDMEMPSGMLLSEKAQLFMARAPESPAQLAFDAAALRVLTSIYRMRLDQAGGCQGALGCFAALRSNQTSAEHTAVAREVATAAVTLLSNDGILPLRADRVRRLAVVGPAAATGADGTARGEFTADYYSGGGSGHCQAWSLVTPLEGIRRRAASAGISVAASAGGSVEEAVEAARGADAVVVVAATTATETADRGSLSLDGGADALIEAVAAVRPTVVLMQTPGAVLTPWRGNVSAIANLFLAGQETGRAWAAVLFGDAAPSGRLPVMFPRTQQDTISPRGGSVPYSEGRFTSYRNPALRAAFPFGHGLSYTTFAYGEPRTEGTSACGARVCLLVPITNTGALAGSEVVQVYLEFPAEAAMPQRVLRGFQKTRLLQPGETEEVMLALSTRDLSTYRSDQGWTTWAGARLHIGASSADIRRQLPLSGLASA